MNYYVKTFILLGYLSILTILKELSVTPMKTMTVTRAASLFEDLL